MILHSSAALSVIIVFVIIILLSLLVGLTTHGGCSLLISVYQRKRVKENSFNRQKLIKYDAELKF